MFSGQTQIHLPNMAYFHIYLGYVSNLSRLQIDFPFTTIRLITNPMNIFRFTFFTVTEFNICTTVYQLFSFQTFATSSQSYNSLERAPLSQRSRTKLSWFTSCECTLAPVRLYSAGLPTAGPNNRFPRPSRLVRSEYRVLKCGLSMRREGTVRNSLGPVSGLDISGEHDTVSSVARALAAAGVKLSTLSTIRQPALACLDSATAFYYRVLLGERAKICAFITHDSILDTLMKRQ